MLIVNCEMEHIFFLLWYAGCYMSDVIMDLLKIFIYFVYLKKNAIFATYIKCISKTYRYDKEIHRV